MKARAKFPHRMIQAFGGLEYVHYEWRRVPNDQHEEAQRLYEQEYLDLLIEKAAEPEPEEIDATEAAIELAESLGIDLASVSGTGVDGRILVSDVRAHGFEEEE